MSQIMLNKSKAIEGEVSIERTVDLNIHPPVMTIKGILSTHRYIEEITSIETDRYLLEGITVVTESFGSNDFNIGYAFIASNLTIKGGESLFSAVQIKDKEKKIKEDKEGERLWQKIIAIIEKK